jgi:hypothetical protein
LPPDFLPLDFLAAFFAPPLEPEDFLADDRLPEDLDPPFFVAMSCSFSFLDELRYLLFEPPFFEPPFFEPPFEPPLEPPPPPFFEPPLEEPPFDPPFLVAIGCCCSFSELFVYDHKILC